MMGRHHDEDGNSIADYAEQEAEPRRLVARAVATGLTAATLRTAMGGTLSLERYTALLPAFTAAMVQADCTTVNRAAMWCAQLGHESSGLRYMQEIASGDAYEGRRDLGNTQKGDGRRFKGHGPIQITGRANHLAVSKWAYSKGYVPTPTYFVDNPLAMASDTLGFLGAVWYWTVARSRINAMCDAGDIVSVTKAVNGGTNGLADRTARWNACRALGAALLPSAAPLPAPSPRAVGTDLVDNIVLTGTGDDTIGIDPPGSRVIGEAYFSLLMVKGPKGIEGTCTLFPQKPGGGTGPVVTLRSRVRNDTSNTSDRDYTRIPDGTDQIDYRWSIPDGCKALLIPAFRAAT